MRTARCARSTERNSTLGAASPAFPPFPRKGGRSTAAHCIMSQLEIVRTVADLRAMVTQYRRSGASIGLVPTMGALHDGHLTLARSAKMDNARVIATLFVNPKQFSPTEDLTRYPRDEAADAAMLQEVGVDLLFAPNVEEIYPDGFATTVTVGGITQSLEGVSRPQFFAGVATVVAKLLMQAQP